MPEVIKDFSSSNEEEILSHAKKIKGMTLADIYKLKNTNSIERLGHLSEDNKGSVGLFLEKYWFGFEPNNSPEPDFHAAGIELKVCPIKKLKSSKLRTKERTKICMINYEELDKEVWLSSHARKKMQKILFVFYMFDKESWESQKILDTSLWELQSDESLIEFEWEKTQLKVNMGKAHEISESGYQALTPSTAGIGKLQSQPHSDIKAKQRAFSLRQSYVNHYWESIKSSKKFESIVDHFQLKDARNIEQFLIDKISPYVGKKIGEIADNLDIPIKDLAKDSAPRLISKILGIKEISKIKEFSQFGIGVKTTPVNAENNFKPHESMSFPKIVLKEFAVEEGYFDSSLSTYLERLFIIPIHRTTSKASDTPLKDRVLLKPFFWSPNEQQLDKIIEEWKMYQQEVIDGKARVIRRKQQKNGFKEITGLTKSSGTEIIHMRPHGGNRKDRDEDPYGNTIVKQSFWLNNSFVQSLIISENQT